MVLGRNPFQRENLMSKKEAERLFIAGGANKEIRQKYNIIETKEEFVVEANKDGYDFTEEEMLLALRDSGDSFNSFGNPRKRSIWWF